MVSRNSYKAALSTVEYLIPVFASDLDPLRGCHTPAKLGIADYVLHTEL